MITEYIKAAMALAVYEYVIEDNGDDPYVFAYIPGLAGVMASTSTYPEAQLELQAALEGWLLIGLRLSHPIPVLAGIDLNSHHVPIPEAA
jgi:predicted RNase H-like HicB family nuclease